MLDLVLSTRLRPQGSLAQGYQMAIAWSQRCRASSQSITTWTVLGQVTAISPPGVLNRQSCSRSTSFMSKKRGEQKDFARA